MNKEDGKGANNKQIGNQNWKLGGNHSCIAIMEDTSLMLNHERERLGV